MWMALYRLVARALLFADRAMPQHALPLRKRVLVFGDSVAWGWIPQATFIPAERYPKPVCWPGVMQAALGAGYEVEVDALPGRTTDTCDPMVPEMGGAQLDGSACLPAAIVAHMPLDLVIIALGANDLKAHLDRSALRIALGAGKLLEIVERSGGMFNSGWLPYPAPKALLVCPAPPRKVAALVDWLTGGAERAEELPGAFRAVATAAGAGFFDTADAVENDGVDGVHLTEAAHRRLGEAMAVQVRAILRASGKSG